MVGPVLGLKTLPVTAGCPLPVAALSLTLPCHAKATLILTMRTIRAHLQGPLQLCCPSLNVWASASFVAFHPASTKPLQLAVERPSLPPGNIHTQEQWRG